MPQTHFIIDGERVPVEQALTDSLRWDYEGAYPFPILKAMVQRDQHDSFTPSKFQNCDRSLWLKINRDYAVDPANGWARLRGTMIHSILEESAPPNSLVEASLTRPLKVDGEWKLITGRTDLIVPADGLVADYKTTKKIYTKFLPKPEHIGQLKLYAWLAQAHGLTLDKGEIIYIEPTSGNTYRCRVMLKPADEAWIEFRVRQLRDVYRGELPPIVALEEQWRCDYCDVRQECEDQALMDGTPVPQGKPKVRVTTRK